MTQSSRRQLIYMELIQLATYAVSLGINNVFGSETELMSGFQVLFPLAIFIILPFVYLVTKILTVTLFNSESTFRIIMYVIYSLVILVDLAVIFGTIEHDVFN